MLNLNHKKLHVWIQSLELVSEIYSLVEKFPQKELYVLSSQLRRASVSVLSNIAEGSARKSKIERNRFYEISRSSLVEIDSQIEIAIKLNYLNNTDIKKVESSVEQIFKMLSKMITTNSN